MGAVGDPILSAVAAPTLPSHGRGHWFDPSIAHGKSPSHSVAL